MSRASVFMLSAFVASLVPLEAGVTRPVDLAERTRGAQRIVVATVTGVTAEMQRNKWGDELIVSRLTLSVEELLKGAASRSLQLDVEGGTLGNITLRVSDLPQMVRGGRAVFFLDAKPDAPGVAVPHLRGLGILPLDESNRVGGTSLTLDTVRAAVRSAVR